MSEMLDTTFPPFAEEQRSGCFASAGTHKVNADRRPARCPNSAQAAQAAPAADALYDARRGVYYTKPALRGWLHLIWFGASLVLGTLLLARAHGAERTTAIAIYAASVSALWIHVGAEPGALMLTGGLLYTAGAISYHRRRPDPYPSVFGYHEVFHAYVCAAATCQFVAIALFIS
jgi:predicted membrane channel-forming protein YqfA (hemolysin III family)